MKIEKLKAERAGGGSGARNAAVEDMLAIGLCAIVCGGDLAGVQNLGTGKGQWLRTFLPWAK